MTKFVLNSFLLYVFALISQYLFLPDRVSVVLFPVLSLIFIFLLFIKYLVFISNKNLTSDIGFLYSVYILAYCILPSILFIYLDYDFPKNFDNLNFAISNPKPDQIGIHLWRFCIFFVGFIIGYLFIIKKYLQINYIDNNINHKKLLIVLSLILILSISIISILLPPADTYIENYTRLLNLDIVSTKILNFLLLLKKSLYIYVIFLLFVVFKDKKYLLLFFIAPIVFYEFYYSMGARIESFSIILLCIIFYSNIYYKIKLRYGLIIFLLLLLFFMIFAFFRESSFDINLLQDLASSFFSFTMELGGVFYPSFHLYSLSLSNQIPDRNILMFFNDLFLIIPGIDHIKYNSQFWYAGHFFPSFDIPPLTLGPIADSAIWGGEFDLFFRAIFNGIIFGFISNLLANSQSSYRLMTYAFFYSTCILSLKYSVYFQIVLYIKIFFFIFIIYMFSKYKSKVKISP